MATSSVVAFWAVAALLIIVPGADWAFTISATTRAHSIVPAVSGLAIGYLGVTAVVAAGVGALVASTPAALTALSVIGGLYLVWHGATTFAHPSTPEVTTAPDGASTWRTLAKGIGVSGLNPKGLLIFIAMLPQFTNPEGDWPVAGQIGLLGLVFTLSCALFYLVLGLTAQAVLHARPAVARGVSRFSGAAMVVIGALLIAERLLAQLY